MEDGIRGSSEAAVAGSHQPEAPFEFLAAPSTDGEFNTARLRPAVVACWRVDDIRFQFDSSFVLPELKKEMALLAKLIAAHSLTDPASPQSPHFPPLSIFGHADTVGDDDYNKRLSGRRSAAIYGLVTRRDEVWEDLYSNTGNLTEPAAGDQWGIAAIQAMLRELGAPIDVDGVSGEQTRGAIRGFQQQQGLAADGEAGPATRRKLFLAYMDKVCVNDADEPFQVDKVEGFLARNADEWGKGDFQGCSEFNPALVFSEQKNAEFGDAPDKTARNEANAPNRRVMVLLFRPDARVIPAKWPCPRAREGFAGCRKRFWSDGEQRRSARLPDADRKYEITRDTFACRFYDRLARLSPCEGVLPVWNVRLFDACARAMPNAPYRMQIGSDTREGFSDAHGWIRERSVKAPARCVLEWGKYTGDPTSKILMYRIEVQVDLTAGSGEEQDEWRLHNLGYGVDCTFEEGVAHFQNDYGLPATGVLDAATSAQLKKVHEVCDPKPKQPAAQQSFKSDE